MTIMIIITVIIIIIMIIITVIIIIIVIIIIAATVATVTLTLFRSATKCRARSGYTLLLHVQARSGKDSCLVRQGAMNGRVLLLVIGGCYYR